MCDRTAHYSGCKQFFITDFKIDTPFKRVNENEHGKRYKTHKEVKNKFHYYLEHKIDYVYNAIKIKRQCRFGVKK